MKLLLLVFLGLLASAEAARKFNSPYALPGDYLDKEDEDYDDDEKTTNAEQSPAKFTTMRDAEEEEQSSGEEEEISQEEQELESRFGPHYRDTLPWSDRDELPLDDGNAEKRWIFFNRIKDIFIMKQEHRVKFLISMTSVTDTGNWPTGQETQEGNFRVQLLFAVCCATLVCSLVFLLCCCAAVLKYNIEKRNFYKKSRCSGEKQKPFSTSFSELPKIVTDSPVSKAAKSWREKMASDKLSKEKSTKSETVPLLESVLVMPPISHASSIESFISNEDLNENDS